MSRDSDVDEINDDIIYPSAVPFVLLHLSCAAAIWSGVTWQAIAICAALYWLRMFAIGAGYHRYFSHRAYSTTRVFQFVLAFLAQSSAQKSILWWAAKHRHHHLHSDTERDVHSPRHKGFIYSHVGWIFDRKHDTTDLVKVADFARYPELMWLHKYELLPAIALGVLCFLAAGWPGLVIGFSGARCSSITRLSASIRSRMFAAASDTSPATIFATIGFWRFSPWVRAGTTITTRIKAAFGRASNGGKSIRPITFCGHCPGLESYGT